MLVFEEGETGIPGEKSLGAKERAKNGASGGAGA